MIEPSKLKADALWRRQFRAETAARCMQALVTRMGVAVLEAKLANDCVALADALLDALDKRENST